MDELDRSQIILKLLEENGFMKVDTLARRLYTSPSSIRRDLTKLERNKLIVRTYGGATATKHINTLTPFGSRKSMNVEQKKRAAKNAAFLLRDGISVMLDGSSTAMQMLKFIQPYKKIKLFTSNVFTFMEGISLGISCTLLGGTPSDDTDTLAGSIAEQAASSLYPDLLFFSSQCVSDDGEISDSIEQETRLRKIMLEHAKTRVFLYDTGKVGKTALYRLCNVRDVEYAFCDLPREK